MVIVVEIVCMWIIVFLNLKLTSYLETLPTRQCRLGSGRFGDN